MISRIDGQTLKQWIEEGERLVIVDGRAEENYALNHIPGAISLLNSDVKKRAKVMIPRGVKVVVYSNDAECPASGIVAAKLDEMGFGPVYDYNDSYEDWVSKGYPTET
jgi:rhodanese-related sulfurtransferase